MSITPMLPTLVFPIAPTWCGTLLLDAHLHWFSVYNHAQERRSFKHETTNEFYTCARRCMQGQDMTNAQAKVCKSCKQWYACPLSKQGEGQRNCKCNVDDTCKATPWRLSAACLTIPTLPDCAYEPEGVFGGLTLRRWVQHAGLRAYVVAWGWVRRRQPAHHEIAYIFSFNTTRRCTDYYFAGPVSVLISCLHYMVFGLVLHP